MNRTKCKRITCFKPPAPDQAYCTRECSPYGYMTQAGNVGSNERGRANAALLAPILHKLQGEGLTVKEVADKMGRSTASVRHYALVLRISFKPDPRTRKYGKRKIKS